MYSKSTREKNIIRLDLAKSLGYVPYDNRQEEFFIRAASFKHGYWDRRCYKTDTLIYDALTFAIMVPNSKQLFVCKNYECQKHVSGKVRNIYDQWQKDDKDLVECSPELIIVGGDSEIYLVHRNTEKWHGFDDMDRMLIDDSDDITMAQLGFAHQLLLKSNGDLIMI